MVIFVPAIAIELYMTQLLARQPSLLIFNTLDLETNNIFFVEQAHNIPKTKQLTKLLLLLFLSDQTFLKEVFLFHTGETKFSYGRKYFFIREKINFHTEESFKTYGRKFYSSRMFFHSGLLTRCKPLLQLKYINL